MSLQVHAWRSSTNFSASATNYISPINGQEWDATEHRGTSICTAAGTFSNFNIVLPSAPGVGKSVVFTLRVNQVDTAAAITISGASTSGQYTSAITLADGDELTIKAVPSGTPTVSNPSVSWDFNSTTSAQSIYGSGNTDGPIALNRTGRVLYHPDVSNWDATNAQDVVACPGTISKATIKLDADVTASGSIMFTITKNGTDQDGSGGTPDTRINFTTGTTKNSATFSLSVAAGDVLTWKAVRTGTPATVRPITGVRLTATTPGQSNYGVCSNATISNVGTRYSFIGAGQDSTDAAVNATESNRAVTLGITGIILSNMRAALNAAPSAAGSDGYTIALRKNSASGSNSVSITGTSSTTGSNASSTTFAAGDTVDIEISVITSPITRSFGAAWIQDQTAAETSAKYTNLERRTRGVGRGVQIGSW